MRKLNKILYFSIINLLTIIPYLLFFIFSYLHNDWLIFLLFYLFLYLGNFWINSLKINFQDIDISLIICLLLGLLGIIFVCLSEWHLFFSYLGAVLVGVCVNYCSFLNSLFTKKYEIKLSKKENIYQIISILVISLMFILIIYFINIYSAFILLFILLFIALQIELFTSKLSLRSINFKQKYTFGLSLIPVVLVSICFMILRSMRIDGFDVSTSLVYSAIIVLFLVIFIIIYLMYQKNIFSFKGLLYSFLKGSLLSITIIYVSIFSLSNYESSVEHIFINLGIPTILALLVLITISDKLAKFSLANLLKGIIILNFIGTYLLLIPMFITLGVFIVMVANLALGNILNEIIFVKKESVARKEKFVISMHSLQKFGSFFAQSIFFLILIATTIIENHSFNTILDNNKLFLHIRIALFFTLIILLIIYIMYEYKATKKKKI